MKCVCLWMMLALLIVMAGCSSQDFGRPIARMGDVVDSGKAYVKDSIEEEGLRRATQLAQILTEWERQKQSVDEDYTLGSDDVMTIGVLALDAPDQVSELTRTISKDGTITLPLVGALPCAGMTARQFQNHVIAAYKGNYLQDPQVDVAVTEYRSAPVVVTGAVGQPGVYYLRHNQSSVLEVLSMADGLSTAAGNDLLIVRRRAPAEGEGGETADGSGAANAPSPDVEPLPASLAPVEDVPEPWTGSHIVELVAALEAEEAAEQAKEDVDESIEAVVEQVVAAADEMDDAGGADDAAGNDLAGLETDLITVDLEGLLDDGDIRLNLPVVGGDIVTVPPGRQEYVYVLGYVQRPGAFELNDRKRVRALQAVAMAGGLSGAARAQNSFLIIDNPTGRQVVSVDLTKIARGQRPPIYMETGYTLVIGSGFFARMAEFIRPSVSAGASLTPGL